MFGNASGKWYICALPKLLVGMIVTLMILSTNSSAAPVLADMINDTDPAYYDVLGPDRFTHDSARSVIPRTIIDSDDNLHLIWDDARNDPNKNDTSHIHEMFYKKFDKDGNILVNNTRLNDNTGINVKPNRWYVPGTSVGMDSDGNIHIAYHEYTRHTYAVDNRINVEIYYMKIDGGLDEGGEPADRDDIVLVDEQRVSTGPAHSGDPDLAVDSQDKVHIVWYDHRSAYYNWEIYYEKLDKNGNVLVDDKRLTYYMDYNAGPEIAIDSDDNLHVLFKNYVWSTGVNSIYYMKLDDDGDTLVNVKKLTTEGVSSSSLYSRSYPGVAVDSDDNLHLVWNDGRDGDNEVYYLKLDDSGDALMSSPKQITDNTGDSQAQGVLVDDSGRIYMPFRDYDSTSGHHQLFFTVLDSDGSYHLDPYQLTVTESLSQSASTAFDSSGSIHLTFVDTITFDPELYHVVFVPLTLDLAFVAYGKPGSKLEINIYEDDVLIDSGIIIRSNGNPLNDMYQTTLEINKYASYDIELDYTPKQKKGKGIPELTVEIHPVEDGKLAEKITEIVLNKEKGTTASFSLDDYIADNY